MALQTLKTIKSWFRAGLKPTQAQFWDTWDSFRHKSEKVPVKDIEGVEVLLYSKADKAVLNDHIADKDIHAPQVNTDWNSEYGLSQLFNKPEFKTINGEQIIGTGDIAIKAEGSNNLQTTLDNGNKTTTGIVFNDANYNWLETNLNSRHIRLTDSNSDMLVGIDSSGIIIREGNQQISLNPQGLFFNRDNVENYLRSNPSSTGTSSINLPITDGTEITLANADNFKTINGESILGSGDIEISNSDGALKVSVNGYLPDLEGAITLPPVSATVTGLVNDISLQELGGTDKTINGIRIGKGNANYENNLVIGRNGLASITTGKYNVAIGNGDGDVEGPLQYLTTGNNNTMVGSDAGVNNITGSNNTGIGTASLFSNTNGSSNTAIGAFALHENLTSTHNVAIGSSALSKMASGLGQSTAIGSFCMSEATSTDKNAAIGTYALRYNTSGFSNTAIGHTALGLNTSGNSNNAVGNYSLGAVTTGAANIGIGKFAGRYVTTGYSNIYIGSEGAASDAEVTGIINIGNRFIVKGTKISLIGTLNINTTPTYENNTIALAGGLTAGDIYRTSTGILMIVY